MLDVSLFVVATNLCRKQFSAQSDGKLYWFNLPRLYWINTEWINEELVKEHHGMARGFS